ncbi:MAG TPA: DUF4388 domain-containing protein [Anaerolineae bacterium]|nr:DUF4388 domain-containing protein [Anaerolineae bacterium]
MFHGNLSDISIAELIEYARREKKPLQLQLQHNSQEANLYFINGRIVRAIMGQERGKSVISTVLGWKEGKFKMNSSVEPSPQTVIQPPASARVPGPGSPQSATPSVASKVPPQPSPKVGIDNLSVTLKHLLAKLDAELPGFMAAAVVDMDGLSIAQHARGKQTAVEKLSAQMALFIKLVETSVGKVDAGLIEDNLLVTKDAFLLFWLIKGQPYFLGIAAARQATLLGHLRLIGRLYVERTAAVLDQTIKGAQLNDRTGETFTTSSSRTGL